MKGYLVVLKQPVRWARANPGYKGLYRGPGWPTGIPEEEEPLDAYVWGPYMDDAQGGLIPTLDLALELYHRFDDSPREFEIIYASTSDEPADQTSSHFLGYDIACVSPFWSIVADWPSDDSLTPFLAGLNENGLFGRLEDAESYLVRYRSVHPEKHKTILHVWRVRRIPVEE